MGGLREETVSYVKLTPEGGWRIAGTRISVDSVVIAYLEGRSPEAIVDSFPSLALDQVYGVLAYYLRNRNDLDAYLEMQHENWKQLKEESEKLHGPLLERIRRERSIVKDEETEP